MSIQIKNRNIFVDFLRGLTIILVVYAHSLQSCNSMESNNSVHLIIQTFQMALFMIISGYCSCFVEPVDDVKNALLGKIKRILIPYLIWEQVHYLLSVVVGYTSYSIKSELTSILTSEFWFLRVLFLLYFAYYCFWMVNNLTYKASNSKAISLIGGGGTGLGMLYVLSKLPGCSSVITYGVMFIIGNIFYKLKRKISRSILHFIFGIGAIAFVVSVYIYFETEGMIHNVIDKSMAITGSMFFTCVASILFQLIHSNQKCISLLLHIGRKTLSIYSIHWCLLFSLNLIDNGNLIKMGFNKYFAALIVALIWMVICLVCIYIVDSVKLKNSVKLKKML